MPSPTNPPAMLIIRDGWGENPNREHDAFNAVRLARTPVADRLAQEWPTTLIRTSGEDVGLPDGTMGNSEVGHQNIGAGRIVDQEILRIIKAIRADGLRGNSTLRGVFEHARATGGAVHLLGLVSDGRVHSDLPHLLALIDLAAHEELPADRLVVHAITDGRDTNPRLGREFVARVETHLARAGVGRIGSVMGRYYAMDRDHRWERVALAYECLTGRVADDATGNAIAGAPAVREAASALAAIDDYYDHPTEPSRAGDEFIVPTRIRPAGSFGAARRPNDGLIKDGDAVIFFNFRGDRPREITKAFVLDDAAWSAVEGGGFARGPRVENLRFCTLTEYQSGLPVEIAFPRPPKMPGILGAVLADGGLTQFRGAETEKFAHVTFFFNDYREAPFAGERRYLVPSPKDVSTYDQKPEMSAPGVRDALLARLDAGDVEPLLVVNFANADMVGHTGNLEAAVRAVETVDECVGALVDAALARNGSVIVTADHGNAEQMWDPATDSPHTAHTTYDVPLIVAGEAHRARRLRAGGRLADIAPTLLDLMGLAKPDEMTGTSLLG